MKVSMIAAALTALALASSPVIAGNGKGKDKDHAGHHAKGHTAKGKAHDDNGLHLGWQKQAWKRGDRIQIEHIEPGYYVDDYVAYDLAPPPEGYRWVRPVDDRYLLVQIATGLISDALGY